MKILTEKNGFISNIFNEASDVTTIAAIEEYVKIQWSFLPHHTISMCVV